MKVSDFEKDPDYKALLKHVHASLVGLTPDERATRIAKMEETLPTTFTAGSGEEFIAKQLLQYAKDLDIELAASKGN